MHTEYLNEGLQIFAIGLGGVFLSLLLIYFGVIGLGAALKERPKSETKTDPAP